MRKLVQAIPLILLAAAALPAQESVTITVHASKAVGEFAPIWAWVGHDEPNYTYSEEGRDLLEKLSSLSPTRVHDRTHNLLTSGDGTPALKWGATNAFTRAASGRPVYDWTLIDRIFDTYKATGVTPLVEIGFMPEALSTRPEPYQHHWPKDFSTGWAYPPKSYEEWSELIEHWVRHMVERYGTSEAAKWEWEVWNEPDIVYWRGTGDEYFKLYDHTVAAVRRALPTARVGGPATTGPANPKAAAFLHDFLEHCASGQNYVTGKKGAPLDFISFHAKGKTALVDGHVELNIGNNLRDIDRGFATIEQFPSLRQLPVILSESDPEGCAACDATSHPENGYRLSSQYASYEAELLAGTMTLAQHHHVRVEGYVSWAFTFPNQPIFAGLRAFTTHDIDLPVLNAFRMFGRMRGEQVTAESTGALALGGILQTSVRAKPDVNVIAARDGKGVRVLVWNYHDDASESAPAEIRLSINGLPPDASRLFLRHWRVDQHHSNAYAAWQTMGSPQEPSAAQIEQLKSAGQLQLVESPLWVTVKNGSTEIEFVEPSQGVSLLDLGW
jgi:xylan 1,4-beta-xylosidase